MTNPATDEIKNIAQLSEEERIRPDLPEMQAIARPRYTMEWGVRERDNALVIHIFPQIEGDNVADKWDETYAMDKRLDYAIPQMFEVPNVHAGFEAEFNSFFIIVQGVIAPDLRLLVQRFLEQIEGAPVSH
jgi:hypothetical protein